MAEQVILVDTEDRVLGEMEKLEVHRKGLLHRAVSVFIFNSEQALLLQKRALSKYHSPGLWTNTACTHPRLNESNQAASSRRLEEEMGIKGVELEKRFHFIYKANLDLQMIEHELDHIFIGHTDQLPQLNPKEACDYKYISSEDLLEDIETNPSHYTYWFKYIITRVIETL